MDTSHRSRHPTRFNSLPGYGLQGFGDGIEADGKVYAVSLKQAVRYLSRTHSPNHSRFTVNALVHSALLHPAQMKRHASCRN
jgi:hypothetical protein